MLCLLDMKALNNVSKTIKWGNAWFCFLVTHVCPLAFTQGMCLHIIHLCLLSYLLIPGFLIFFHFSQQAFLVS